MIPLPDESIMDKALNLTLGLGDGHTESNQQPVRRSDCFDTSSDTCAWKGTIRGTIAFPCR